MNGTEVKVVVASGLKNAQAIMDEIKSGKADYQFVEIMACPGGCINGGGQPYVHDEVRNNIDLKTVRAQALYDYDAQDSMRCSHENPAVTMLYSEFLGEPNSHKAHKLLHTTYSKRDKY